MAKRREKEEMITEITQHVTRTNVTRTKYPAPNINSQRATRNRGELTVNSRLDPHFSAAETTACRMVHAIDERTINRLVSFGEFLFQCPGMGDDWIQSFMEYCQSQKFDRQKCDKCLDTWKNRT